MDKSRPRPELVGLLRIPLEYAAGLDPERLAQVMPDLAGTLKNIVERNAGAKEGLAPFMQLATGIDALPPRQKSARVTELLRLLDRIEAGTADKPGGSDPQAGEHRADRGTPEDEPPRRPPGQPPEPGAGPDPPEVARFLDSLAALDTEIQYVKGVGPRWALKFQRLKIETVADMLYHLPARYEDRRQLKSISDIREGERATVLAEIITAGPVQARRQRQYHMLLSDGTGLINAVWFKYRGDYLEKLYRKGQWVIATGAAKKFRSSLQMAHPDLAHAESEGEENAAGIIPVYPSTEGVHQKYIRRVAARCLDGFSGHAREILPASVVEKRAWPPLGQSLRMCHQPDAESDMAELNEHRSVWHQRLAYEELFLLELGLALRRKGVVEEDAPALAAEGELLLQFQDALPFEFTRAQHKVIREVLADMARPHPMLRLLQGDVGSGKTVVALAAALTAIEAGHQAAIMAPTEILAEQHYRTVETLLEGMGLTALLLTGSVRGAERQQVLSMIADGRAPLLVGTHAVIQDKVKFKSLGLGVVDEQHRFGVMQRANLKAKGPRGLSPHLLVMTATPIPRTLAMTVYGDLRVSVIREMPKGRRPVKTKVYREKDRAQVYKEVRAEVGRGRQAFIVYPLVEESETLEMRDALSMHAELRDVVFPDLSVGLIHGRMKSAEKDLVMRSFQRGEIDVLVATTVIEVGIDVANATLMVIENAEHFGLSQLHQLRGRVGRSEHASRCLLVSAFTRSEDAWKRLKVMEKTSDGFKIAEEDLALRGPGEFFGTRQSGLPDFRVANIIRDAEVLSMAREDAFELVAQDPDLSRPEHRVLGLLLKRRWGNRLRLGRVG